MTVNYNRDDVIYTFETADMTAGSTVPEIVVKGSMAYNLTNSTWYIVKSDLSLAQLSFSTVTGGSVIALTGNENYIGHTSGTGFFATGSFTGNSASLVYDVNETVLPNAGGVVEIPNTVRIAGALGYITDISLMTDKASITPQMRVHFYSASTVTLAPNAGSFVSLFADSDYYLGYYTLSAMTTDSGSASNMSRATTTDASTETQPRILVQAQPTSKSIFYALENRTSFTSSASQVWKLKLRMDQY